MATTSFQKAGRKYEVDSSGITTLEKDFIVQQDAVMDANGETLSFPGVPAIGSAHPKFSGLYVQGYKVAEGTASDKALLTVTVTYSPETVEVDSGGEAVSVVDEWGWDDGTAETEFQFDAVDGSAVLNSAGDAFDTVPRVMTPAPVFTKVMRFTARQTGWASCFCKVNQSAMTIGGISCPPASLLCTICEKRLIGEERFKYQYTVRLRYKSNFAKIEGADTLANIGWDVAIVDAGMRIKNAEGKLVRIKTNDAETGQPGVVTSSVLLDGNGGMLAADGKPYAFRGRVYARASFPSWFTSEPN